MSRPIIIAGGGTGGHVYPALAIADALVAAGCDRSDISFVGSRRGIEARVVPETGYRLTLLPGRGIKRSLSFDNVGAVLGLLIAFMRALWMVFRNRPSVVVSVGGYAAAPCVFAAAVLRVPLVLAESNAVPGAVHRLAGRFATASAVALPGTPLPRAVVTGNPVRPEIANLDRSSDAARAEARRLLSLPENRFVIAAFGGSLGARTINRAISELAQRWADRSDVIIHHVVGRRDFTATDFTDTYHAVEYETQMAALYLAADVVVCRAGATTIAEVAAAGIPAIFVPLPNAPGDHQTANARVFEEVGAALMVPDHECTADRLETLLSDLFAEPDHLETMSSAAKTLARIDAAERVAEIVLASQRRS